MSIIRDVATLVLYKEGTAKNLQQPSGRYAQRVVRGYGGALRSMRATWTSVLVEVDFGSGLRIKACRRYLVDVPAGTHRIAAEGLGLVPSATSIEIRDGETIVLAITPDYPESVSQSAPLGGLRLHVARDPIELQPYQFYRSIPSRRESVLPALAFSAVASVVVLAVIAVATLLGLYFLLLGRTFGLLPLASACLMAPVVVPAGVGGVVTAIRFLQLPADWRSPPRVATK